MNKVKVKNESLPNRCEICHQLDKFDPYNNYCERCKDFANPQNVITNLNNDLDPFGRPPSVRVSLKNKK